MWLNGLAKKGQFWVVIRVVKKRQFWMVGIPWLLRWQKRCSFGGLFWWSKRDSFEWLLR